MPVSPNNCLDEMYLLKRPLLMTQSQKLKTSAGEVGRLAGVRSSRAVVEVAPWVGELCSWLTAVSVFVENLSDTVVLHLNVLPSVIGLTGRDAPIEVVLFNVVDSTVDICVFLSGISLNGPGRAVLGSLVLSVVGT